MKTKLAISSRGSNRCTRKSRNSWRKFKHSIKLGMTNKGLIIIFQVGDQVWLHNNNERLNVEGKKLNPIHTCYPLSIILAILDRHLHRSRFFYFMNREELRFFGLSFLLHMVEVCSMVISFCCFLHTHI
jgi:hypothetical protein